MLVIGKTCNHEEINQMICNANQLTGFYMIVCKSGKSVADCKNRLPESSKKINVLF